MKLRRRKNEVPGLNTTSTADISFMFLIFFLVTTSMFVDKGVVRKLPPKEKEKQEQKDLAVDKKNIMTLKLDANGNLTVNDSAVAIGSLGGMLSDFILRRGKEHIITIESDANCKYDAYFHVQNELAKAYQTARENIAQRDYGRSMSQLTSNDRETVLEKCPQRVAENYNEGE